MSLNTYLIDTNADSFPRVSGDEPPSIYVDWATLQFSPRERG